ncbi:hypothetical protein KCU88_g143, partial [Aureobasidium melanogenum]
LVKRRVGSDRGTTGDDLTTSHNPAVIPPLGEAETKTTLDLPKVWPRSSKYLRKVSRTLGAVHSWAVPDVVDAILAVVCCGTLVVRRVGERCRRASRLQIVADNFLSPGDEGGVGASTAVLVPVPVRSPSTRSAQPQPKHKPQDEAEDELPLALALSNSCTRLRASNPPNRPLCARLTERLMVSMLGQLTDRPFNPKSQHLEDKKVVQFDAPRRSTSAELRGDMSTVYSMTTMASYATGWLPASNQHQYQHQHQPQPQPQPQPISNSQPFPHSVTGKRRADEVIDPLESQSNISSHFKKLRLNHARPQSIQQPQLQSQPQVLLRQQAPPSSPLPPQLSSPNPTTTTTTTTSIPTSITTTTNTVPGFRAPPPNDTLQPGLISPIVQHQDVSQSLYKMPTIPDSDFMTVDDTPHRVIISDLDAEIAQIEAAEAEARSAVFLPDIDKKVSSIPSRVLNNNLKSSPPPPPTNALVLYREPTSISIPEEMDVVRKAIVAARARARQKQAEEFKAAQQETRTPGSTDADNNDIDLDDEIVEEIPAPVHTLPGVGAGIGGGAGGGIDTDQEDVDAMEIE